MRVGLVFGGRSVEHQVSLNSARTVAAALERAGHEVVPLAVAQDGCWLSVEDSAAALRMEQVAAVGLPVVESLGALVTSGVEVLFPLIHGTWGEDGTLQGLSEMADLPYVGAGVVPSALGMDKLLTKHVLEPVGIPVVDYEAVDHLQLGRDPAGVAARVARLGSPVFVKPCVGGSSVGVRRVARPEDLAAELAHALRFDERVLVERAVEGRELECAVLGYGELRASVLGEIEPSREFYDYEDKYLLDEAGLHAPADVPRELSDRLREMAVRAFAAIGGWGMARVDFLLEKDGEVWVNEINTLPGFTSISMYPRLWEVSGLPIHELVERLVQIAVERHRHRRELDDGIKEWLASLD